MKCIQFTHETSDNVLMQIGDYNLVYVEASSLPDGAILYDSTAKDMLVFQPGYAGIDKEVCVSWDLIHKYVSAIDLEASVSCACVDSLKSILGVDGDTDFRSIIMQSVEDVLTQKLLFSNVEKVVSDVSDLVTDVGIIKDDVSEIEASTKSIADDTTEIESTVNDNKNLLTNIDSALTDVSSSLTSLGENLSSAISESETNVKKDISSTSTQVKADITEYVREEILSVVKGHSLKFDQYLLDTESNVNQLFALANKQLKDFIEAGFDLATKEVSFSTSTESLTIAVGRVNLLINQLQLIESQIANFTGVTSVLEALVTALEANFSNLEVAKESYDNLEDLYNNLLNDFKRALDSFQKASTSLSDKMLLLDQRDNTRLSEVIRILEKWITQKQSDSKSDQIMGSVDLALKALTTVNELTKKEDTL